MEINETYAFLGKIRYTSRKIDERQLQLRFLGSKLLPSGIRYDTDRVQTSPSDRMPEIMGEIEKVQQEIDQLKGRLISEITEVGAVIDNLSNDNEKTVLKMYFLSLADVSEIARTMHYTEDGIYTIRRRGIKNIGKIVNYKR